MIDVGWHILAHMEGIISFQQAKNGHDYIDETHGDIYHIFLVLNVRCDEAQCLSSIFLYTPLTNLSCHSLKVLNVSLKCLQMHFLVSCDLSSFYNAHGHISVLCKIMN